MDYRGLAVFFFAIGFPKNIGIPAANFWDDLL